MAEAPDLSERGRFDRGRRLAIALCAVLALGGCVPGGTLVQTTTPAPAAPAPPAVKLGTVSQPSAQREHERILATYGGVYENPRLEAMLGEIVTRLVAASERPDLAYKATILNSSAVNAFALPTGQLYVTRGLLALANDESEVASVLSHEMAHVTARHAAIREDKARQSELVNRVVNDVLTDPQAGAMALARSRIALASFSRAQEFEADGIGVAMSARAQYDPYGAARFLASMGRQADLKLSHSSQKGGEFLSSHPATPERVANALAQARRYSAPDPRRPERAAYLGALDGMTYGDDPNAGYVRGRQFIHPRLGFTFEVPEGFGIDNTADAVVVARQSGGEAMRLDVVRVSADQTLTDYLTSGWIEAVDRASVEPVTVNGFAGATALAKGEHWQFRLYALRVGSDVYRFIFATRQRNAESDKNIRDIIQSFRRLSVAEIESAAPLHLQVRSVAAGDTVESLARQMAIADRPLERFRALNGLSEKDTLRVGDTVKLVIE